MSDNLLTSPEIIPRRSEEINLIISDSDNSEL